MESPNEIDQAALRRRIDQIVIAVNQLGQLTLPRSALRIVIVGASFRITQLVMNLLVALHVGDMIAGLLVLVVFVITLVYLLRSLPRVEAPPISLEERPPWLKP